MNRTEIIAAVQEALGRSLTREELAYVDRTIEIRRGAIAQGDIPVLVNDIERGAIVTQESPGAVAGGTSGDRRTGPTGATGAGRSSQGGIEDRFADPGFVPPNPMNRLSPEFRRRLENAAADVGVSTPELQFQVAQAAMQADAFRSTGQDFSIEDILEPVVREWEVAALQAGPQPIGVDKGFTATPEQTLDAADRKFAGGAPSITREVDPRYFEGDELNPASMSPEVISAIQKRLESAGLLEAGTYYPGVWDNETRLAYKTVLGYANQQGVTADTAIERLIENLPESVKDQRDRVESIRRFQAPPFIEPDKATLAQSVKGWFRSQIGREPSDAELAEWGQVISGHYRSQHDVQVDMARAQFDAETRTIDETNAFNARLDIAEDVDPADRAHVQRGPAFQEPAVTRSVGSQTFQAVDPIARFREAFENRYRPEINRLASLDEIRSNRASVYSSLRTMSSLIGSR